MHRSAYRRHLAGMLMLTSTALTIHLAPTSQYARRKDEALFDATIAVLADSLAPISRMIGPAGSEPLRVDPRPLRSTAIDSPSHSYEQAEADIWALALDSISATDRAARVAIIRKRGFTPGDLAVLIKCPAAEVGPPNDPTWEAPKFCTFTARGVGLVVERQTATEATVKVVIVAVQPVRSEYTARFTFVHDRGWRLTQSGPWVIAE